MKTAEAKISSSTVHPKKRGNEPFFSNQRQGIFFTKSNGVSQTFFRPTTIQAKLTIGQPNDKYEQEADAMADKVIQRMSVTDMTAKKEPAVQAKPIMATITPFVQTKCAACEQEEKIQEKKEEGGEEHLKKIQRRPIFESNAEPSDDEKTIQRKCEACASSEHLATSSTTERGTGTSKLEMTRQGIDNLVKKEYHCPSVADSVTNISALAPGGTLGLTQIDKSSNLICVPKFVIDTKVGNGVFKPVQVSLSMTSKFAKPEKEAATSDKISVPNCKTDVPIFMTITDVVSKLANIGEQEHCDDVKLAFDQTVVPCSKEVNKLSGQKFTGKTEDECLNALTAKLGFDPIDCS
ncbi:MAG: hypothetical protein ACKVOW_04440, partial [Chitinophagaceae bacterium]